VNKGEKMFKVPSKNLKRISSCHILSNFCPEAILNFGCEFLEKYMPTFLLLCFVSMLSSEGKSPQRLIFVSIKRGEM